MMQNYLEEVGRTSPCTSLVPRPLPDFISQPWRKSGEGLGSLLRHGPEMVDSVNTWRKIGRRPGIILHHGPEMVDSVYSAAR